MVEDPYAFFSPNLFIIVVIEPCEMIVDTGHPQSLELVHVGEDLLAKM